MNVVGIFQAAEEDGKGALAGTWPGGCGRLPMACMSSMHDLVVGVVGVYLWCVWIK